MLEVMVAGRFGTTIVASVRTRRTACASADLAIGALSPLFGPSLMGSMELAKRAPAGWLFQRSGRSAHIDLARQP
jgi:hypothetical protein